jgi:hypothetical protein
LVRHVKQKKNTLFCVSIYMDNRITNKREGPQNRLHFGSEETNSVIGDIRFRRSATSNIIFHRNNDALANSDAATSNEMHVKLTKKGGLTTDVQWTRLLCVLPQQNGRQAGKRYEWRHSGGPEIKGLATDNVGVGNYSQDERAWSL